MMTCKPEGESRTDRKPADVDALDFPAPDEHQVLRETVAELLGLEPEDVDPANHRQG